MEGRRGLHPRTDHARAVLSFDEPGFAKIATSLRVDPYGNDSSILTMETRVAITDDASRRRFRRYWLVIGPFSSLIRRMALRLLATELRRSTPGSQTMVESGSHPIGLAVAPSVTGFVSEWD